jgi:hypothetical protein
MEKPMSNLLASDIPNDVRDWLNKQEETIAIFKMWWGAKLVTGGVLLEELWRYFELGKLKAFLDHI